MTFKQDCDLEARKAEAASIRAKYPDHVPIIVEKAYRSDVEINKKKFLVPRELTVGQFVYVIRTRMELDAEKALFLFVNNTLAPTSAIISAIDKDHKDEDGFLYFTYAREKTFG